MSKEHQKLSAPNHNSQTASGLNSRSPNHKNFPTKPLSWSAQVAETRDLWFAVGIATPISSSQHLSFLRWSLCLFVPVPTRFDIKHCENLALHRIGKRPHKQDRAKIHQKYQKSYFWPIFCLVLRVAVFSYPVKGTANHAPSPQKTFLIGWYFWGGGVRIVGT